MRCGVHIGVEMELTEKQAPGWLTNPNGADETGEKDNNGGVPKKRFTRKFWKCPLPGCFRVAAFDANGEKPEQRPCPKCGDPSDANAVQMAHGDSRCRKCRAAYAKAWGRKRVAERAAARMKKKIDNAPPESRGIDVDLVVRGGRVVTIPRGAAA